MVFTVVASLFYSGILRKLAAKMQSRVGPPIWQPFFDMLKLFGNEEVKPEQAGIGFGFWPFAALASVLTAALLTPIAGIVGVPSNIILLVYFISFGSVCLFLAGLSSSNPFAVVGSIRGIVQMFSYEITFIVSLLVPVAFLGTLDPLVINNHQLGLGITGWLAFSFPLAALAFLIAVLAKVELPPFHVPEAHQEIVSGYFTEYSGFKLAVMEMTGMIKTFVLLALGVAVFFGGAADLPVFIAKTLALLFVLSVVRVLMARFRLDQVLKFCWAFGLLAVIDLARVLVVGVLA
jgi:NADH-quinone oxidoreductase subunit H